MIFMISSLIIVLIAGIPAAGRAGLVRGAGRPGGLRLTETLLYDKLLLGGGEEK